VTRMEKRYLAGGSFGDVYKCCYQNGSMRTEVAVKAFRFKFTMGKNAGDKSVKMLRRELGIWKRLDHANIVPFLGIAYGFGMSGSMSLVSLWMPNGSLYKFLGNHASALLVTHRLQFLLDIANGLLYLHSRSIAHGDLNCNNILVDRDYTARLVDFGYASLVGNIPQALQYLQMSTTRPGALRWAAPEQINSEDEFKGTTKSDVYSFGCVALQVLSGKVPWSEVREDMAIAFRLMKGHKPSRPTSPQMNDLHWNLIQDCWSHISQRPDVQMVILGIQRFLDECPQSMSLRDLLASSSSDTDASILSQPAFLTDDLSDRADQTVGEGVD